MKKIAVNSLADLCRKNWLLNNAAQYTYLKILPEFASIRKAVGKEQPSDGADVFGTGPLKIAFVCDEMTWLDFYPYSQAIFLSPVRWREQMERFSPDLFFCESAWSGAICGWPDWRGRIYRNETLNFENREPLLCVLDYCNARGIPTVFWNKEDPTFFAHPHYNFVDTALRFDVLLTTAEECVPKYRALGHERTCLLTFGVNTSLFHPQEGAERMHRAVFAGSWFGDQPKRCEDTERLFDYVLDQGIPLDIYDRNYGTQGEAFQYPKKYQPYIRPGVPYPQLAQLLNQYEYAVNVNTVFDSRTMCSRRVLQLGACGAKIISNRSPAMESIHGLVVDECVQDGNIVQMHSVPEIILREHTTESRFRTILEAVPHWKREAELDCAVAMSGT